MNKLTDEYEDKLTTEEIELLLKHMGEKKVVKVNLTQEETKLIEEFRKSKENAKENP